MFLNNKKSMKKQCETVGFDCAMKGFMLYYYMFVQERNDRMESYYEDILKEIRKHMEEGNHKAAYDLLEDELAMPYIPKDSEKVLIDLYNECRSILRFHRNERVYDDEDIERLLKGSLEEQFMAVELLKKSNLRHHLQEVEQYLCDEPDVLVRALLIDAMMEQNIAEEMHTVVNDMEISFLPCYIEPVMRAKGAIVAANALYDWFENEDPSFLSLCMECLLQECYLHLPFNMDEDEGIPLALAIVHYVKRSQGDENGFVTFLTQHRLEQEHGFALLLNKHGI